MVITLRNQSDDCRIYDSRVVVDIVDKVSDSTATPPPYCAKIAPHRKPHPTTDLQHCYSCYASVPHPPICQMQI